MRAETVRFHDGKENIGQGKKGDVLPLPQRGSRSDQDTSDVRQAVHTVFLWRHFFPRNHLITTDPELSNEE